MIDGRNTLTTIVQSSAVELFNVFEIAIAPILSMKTLPSNFEQQLSATTSFMSDALSGNIVLFVPHEVYAIAKHPVQRSYEPRDWTREMCNQLLGRIKNRLHGCDISLRTGLPTSVTGALLERHRSDNRPEAVFGFRSLRGDVTISLVGKIDFKRILYTGKALVAKEGDVILF